MEEYFGNTNGQKTGKLKNSLTYHNRRYRRHHTTLAALKTRNLITDLAPSRLAPLSLSQCNIFINFMPGFTGLIRPVCSLLHLSFLWLPHVTTCLRVFTFQSGYMFQSLLLLVSCNPSPFSVNISSWLFVPVSRQFPLLLWSFGFKRYRTFDDKRQGYSFRRIQLRP